MKYITAAFKRYKAGQRNGSSNPPRNIHIYISLGEQEEEVLMKQLSLMLKGGSDPTKAIIASCHWRDLTI
jgi:hypothetical protein